MALVNKIFWAVAVIEAVFFLTAFLMTIADPRGSDSGGREMSLIFGILLPFLVLGIASLIYWKTDSPVLHVVLLVVVAAPVALMANVWIIRPWMDKRADETGALLYTDPSLQKFVAAIARRDSDAVRTLAKSVNVNAVSDGYTHAYTPLTFAVKKAVETEQKGEQPGSHLEMVRLLLSLRARPDPALTAACGSPHGDIMRLLLDAGGNPNFRTGEGQFEEPGFFACLGPGGLESLKALEEKGAKLDATSAGGEWAITKAAGLAAMVYSTKGPAPGLWSVVLYLHERGAKLDAPQKYGMTVARNVEDAMKSCGLWKVEPPEDLKRVAALLKE